jgi:hypothetical protein
MVRRDPWESLPDAEAEGETKKRARAKKNQYFTAERGIGTPKDDQCNGYPILKVSNLLEI